MLLHIPTPLPSPPLLCPLSPLSPTYHTKHHTRDDSTPNNGLLDASTASVHTCSGNRELARFPTANNHQELLLLVLLLLLLLLLALVVVVVDGNKYPSFAIATPAVSPVVLPLLLFLGLVVYDAVVLSRQAVDKHARHRNGRTHHPQPRDGGLEHKKASHHDKHSLHGVAHGESRGVHRPQGEVHHLQNSLQQ